METTTNTWNNPELPASIYKAQVVRVEEYSETNSVNVVCQVNGVGTQRIATFVNDGKFIGTNFETIRNLKEGQQIKLQNSSSSNVPEKIWILLEE